MKKLTDAEPALAAAEAAEALTPIPGIYTVGDGVYEVFADGTATFMKPAKAKATVKVLDEVPASVCRVAAKVTSISDKAFSNKKVRKVLKKVNIGANVQVIGKGAFTGCKGLSQSADKERQAAQRRYSQRQITDKQSTNRRGTDRETGRLPVSRTCLYKHPSSIPFVRDEFLP